MYDVLLVNNPLLLNTDSVSITVDLENLAYDIAEMLVRAKRSNEELYEYDEVNDIYLFKEQYYQEILQLKSELIEYLVVQHAI